MRKIEKKMKRNFEQEKIEISKKVASDLDVNGYEVVTACTPDQVSKLNALFDADLAKLGTGIDTSNYATMDVKNRPGIASVGIFKDPDSGFGQSKSVWEARRICADIFRQKLNAVKVSTSYDGACLWPNWAKFKSAKDKKRNKTKSSWWHVDQCLFKSQFCLQGMLLLTDATISTGGFYVVPGSHKIHEQVLTETGNHNKKENFIPLPPPSEIKCVDAQEKFVEAKAGDLILWNSKLMHTSKPGVGTSEHDPDCLRKAIYISMVPTDTLSQDDHKFRNKMVDQGDMTNHWCTKPEMKRESLSYPRHKSFPQLSSAALPSAEINKNYSELF